ncbi:hypothetical protein BKA58DRAFT_394792 [Alternaria rosae]|uniref:uncharacterized protein n=1 Tax=Alternaria rosae TaxID=1187941 RepID=UPI001E8D0CA8|nr:uncharacterized protein BKA58DRAFT_394792 [Alternaria rosae]KAH6853063.1 hypothetical protein BKA58DRAFT_394792 [Alternaria rosae]
MHVCGCQITKMRITRPIRNSSHFQDSVSAPVLNIRRRLHTPAASTKDHVPSAPRPTQQAENPSLPSFNLFKLVHEAKPAVRYTVYAGLGLMATVETTFWFHVLRAKSFPRASAEEQEKADALLQRLNEAMKNYRHVYMANYGRYYGAHVWGLGYGGLDGLET